MKVDELAERIIDYRGKTPPKVSTGVPLITAKVIKGGRILDTEEFISEETYGSWMRRGIPRQWDLLVTTEAPLGEVALIRTAERIALAQRVILIRCRADVVDQRYLSYAFQSPLLQGRLRARATGTTVQGIKQSELREVEVPLPPTRVQRKIAAVLAAHDELIENNLRRIEILEEMAQAVYREWFVNFHFPGHEDVAFVDPPLGSIPAGWKAGKFGDIAVEVKDGVDPTGVDPETRYVGLEHIPQESFTLAEHGSATDVTSRKWQFDTGDVLFGKLRPYFHKVAEAGFPGICSTDALVIRAAEEYRDLTLQTAFSREFVGHAVSTSGGTDRPRAKWSDLADFDLALPDARTNAAFSDAVRPMVDLAANLVRQNANLRATRDLLLPRLVSGELDVSDLDIETAWLAS